MKAVILAGGLGTRLSEETSAKPKPMVEIGGKPILWHIMKIYSAHGINDFVICCGYKGYLIKEFFVNYFMHTSDVVVDLKENQVEIKKNSSEPWSVTLADTGEATNTGGRLKRIESYISEEDSFCFTYGDGVGDIDITSSIQRFKSSKKLALLTATRTPGRFGNLKIEDDDVVSSFAEKPDEDGTWINGGYFVLSPKVLDYIPGDDASFEALTLKELSESSQLVARKHRGFWQPMDTLQEKNLLNSLWDSGDAPWKIWE
tara:strand:+ start:305 stop:1081 length:777 start_codon:yes stop_codon:yes gene_type:complete